MISFSEARATILKNARPIKGEAVGCQGFPFRVPAETLVTEHDLPRFDNSAVDGYAVRAADAGPRRIVGESAAGGPPSPPVGPNEAVRIFTGAPLPEGADAVVMQEDARPQGEAVEFDAPPALGHYVRRRGEDIPAGTRIDLRGRVMTPPMIGLLASLGVDGLKVHGNPRVTVLATGDELGKRNAPLGPSQIYASNHEALESALRWLLVNSGSNFLPDDPEVLRKAFGSALDRSDVLITIGGVSVGDHDHVRTVLADLGVREVFWRVNMKPGKPFFFGKVGRKLVFGLPGNPVSALVTFQTLVRPALLKMKGISDTDVDTVARLGAPIRRTDLRYEFLRATLADGVATPIGSQGSHIQTGLVFADALIHVPDGVASMEAGDAATVTPLKWSLGT